MKFYKPLLQIIVVIMFFTNTGCKKYGYEVADGYSDSSEVPNTSGDVDTIMSVVDRTKYNRARVFPGLVDNSEPRVMGQKFTIDMNFSQQTSENLRIKVAPGPMFSTGYYAAPGELIKIDVPQGINGLSVQIGGHTDNLTGLPTLLRDPLIYNLKQLFPGQNYIRNLYGGTIYIWASFSIPQPVEFTISGAVVSPDFVLGTTQDMAWFAQVKASKVPWLELRSKRVIYLVPRDMIIKKFSDASDPLTSPTILMTEWNKKFELDYNGWMGLSDDATDVRDKSTQAAWRGILDIQPKVGAAHNGFPFVGTMNEGWFNYMTGQKQLFTKPNWGLYHEFGHNCQQPEVWSWSTLGETTCNLFAFKVGKRNGLTVRQINEGNADRMDATMAYVNSTPVSGVVKDFDRDAAINEPIKRTTPFLQIFELYGYDAMTYLYTAARHAERLSINDIDKHDFVYERFSEYAKIDLAPFFDAWGILISTQSQDKISAKYPPLTKQIWSYNIVSKAGGTAPIVTTVVASSNQANDGKPESLLDNNTSTYWQSQVTPTAGSYPYNLVLNLGYRQKIKGVSFTPRNSPDQRIKNIEILVSDNNVLFTSVATTQIPNSFAQYNFNFPSGAVAAKYVKVILTDSWTTSKVASLSELRIIK